METPSSSTRRMTRSMTMAAAANNGTTQPLTRKTDESEKTAAKLKQQQQERNALIDITNDSPIIGLAMGSLRTPSSAMSKKKRGPQFTARTPGSGEALLRGQVKTLLQKVEEEAELSKLIVESRNFFSSPINLVAPTPANTPQIPNLSYLDEIVVHQKMMSDEKKQEERVVEADNVEITRSLLLDFSEKSSDLSDCSSILTYQGALECRPSADEDDDAASVWSIQANASSTRDDDESEEEGHDPIDVEEEEEEEEEEGFGEKNEDDYSLGELCEGLSKVWVEDDAGPRFTGKHIRFMYNDGGDEIQGEEKQIVLGCEASCGVLKLKGLPTPKGKHIRFAGESE